MPQPQAYATGGKMLRRSATLPRGSGKRETRDMAGFEGMRPQGGSRKTEGICTRESADDPDELAPAVGYIRVSTDEQVRGGVSLDTQEERIRAYCTMTGLQLAFF